MKICVKNIGLINNSDIEINGITVIGGYNNTGKSTILKAIYGLLSSNHNLKKEILQEKKRSIQNGLRENEFDFLIEDENVEIFLDHLIKQSVLKPENNNEETFYKFFKKMSEKNREDYEIRVDLFSENNEAFEEHYEKLIKRLYHYCHKIFNTPEKEYQKFILARTIRNVFSGDINSRNCKEPASIEIRTNGNMTFFQFEQNQLVHFKMFPDFQETIWYLNTSHFINYKKENYLNRELRHALQTEMPIDISYKDYSDIEDNNEKLKSILKDILHGRLETDKLGTMMFYRDHETGESFHMDNIASGMKNLLVIQRMLENGTLGKNSILLIDEPETNLHPDWQIKYAKILVLLNKEMNIKLLVNSHSPYFIRAIEVALADYGMKQKGKFYLTVQAKQDKTLRYQTIDVTKHTEEIYKLLYQPLNYL